MDAAVIAQACGVTARVVAEKWSSVPSWPRGEYVGRQHRVVWPVGSLPELLVRRGREIRVRERVAVWLALRTAATVGVVPEPQQPDTETAAAADPCPRGRRRAPPEPTWEEIQARSARYERLPGRYRDEAMRRVSALVAVDQLVSQGEPLQRARELVSERLRAEGQRCDETTLWRWANLVRRVPRPHWCFFLTPKWSGGSAEADYSPEAWDAFKADYLRPEAPNAAAVYRRVQRLAGPNGWKLPSVRTFQRRLEREISPHVLTLARKGVDALMKMYPAQERDKTALAALEAVNADGHRIDVFVRHPLGHVCRPILVAFQDVYSGRVLAWRWGETESADLVRMALFDLVHHYGIPRAAWLDNGRAFASKFITGGTRTRYRFKVRDEDPVGIAVALGIEIHWATPYHGQAKPIERAFRDLAETLAKHPSFAGAYVGNNPTAKPENYGSKAIEWAEFVKVADAEIRAHNAREGRRSKVAGGRSFDQVFNASYSQAVITQATPTQLRALMLAADTVRCSATNGSVSLAGNRYWTEALSRYAGERVIVRFDPDCLHSQVHVCGLDGSLIADAPCVASVGFADTAAATEHQRARNQFKRAAKQQLKAEKRMAVATLVNQLAALPETGDARVEAQVIAPLFNVPTPRRTLPTLPEEAKATGTDGYVSAMDELIRARMKRMEKPRRDDD